MIIYIITFLSSCLFANKAQKNENNKKKLIINSIIAIMIPSIVAGLRDFNIGVDVLVYGKNIFYSAVNSKSLLSFLNTCDADLLYEVFNYIISRITNDLNMFLFFMELFNIVLIYITLYRNRNKNKIWIGLLIFFCFFYNRTFNLLRQSMALSVIFFGTYYLDNKKNLKFIISVIIASLFHSTAIICLIMIPIKLISEMESKKRIVYSLCIIILFLFSILNYDNILAVLINTNLISSKMTYYISNKQFEFYIIETFIKILLLFVWIIFLRQKDDKRDKYHLLIVVISILLFQLRGFADYADRIGFYFEYMYFIIYSKNVKINKKNKMISKLLIIIISVVYWIYKYIIMNSCNTFPYTSSILGI